MTIEIRQLIIRAVVEQGRALARSGDSVGSAAKTNHTESSPIELDDSRRAIVATCVRDVLRKLERARERER